MSGRGRHTGALKLVTALGLGGTAAVAAAEPGLPTVPALIESRVPSVDPLLRGGDGRVPPEVERALGSPRLAGPSGLLPHPDDSSKSIEGTAAKLRLTGKVKDCCGYPLGQPGLWKMTFYWLAYESEYASEPADIDIYTKDGFLIGRFPRVFVFELKLEGTGVLRDGRVFNYDRPCPFGIGTCFKELDRREHPVGKGAQHGVLIRDAEALEKMEAVDTLVVDKTGTLTEGRPRVVQVETASGFDADDVLRKLASVERASEHPIGHAIVRVLEAAHESLRQHGRAVIPHAAGDDGQMPKGTLVSSDRAGRWETAKIFPQLPTQI